MFFRLRTIFLLFFSLLATVPAVSQLNYERLAENACDCLPTNKQLTQNLVDSCLAESASEAVFSEIMAHGSIQMEVEGLNELYDLSMSYFRASCERVAQFMLRRPDAIEPHRQGTIQRQGR
jgi:hypothetical protein